MTQEIYFREFIAVAQKTTGAGLGEGFNYWVEAGFNAPADIQEESLHAAMKSVINRIDHRALGVDLDLGFNPTSEALCRWIKEEITKLAPTAPVAVKMWRGDGASFHY